MYTVGVASSGMMFVPDSVKICCWFKSWNEQTTQCWYHEPDSPLFV